MLILFTKYNNWIYFNKMNYDQSHFDTIVENDGYLIKFNKSKKKLLKNIILQDIWRSQGPVD